MTTPTQVRRPWRATLRSVFQLVIALATLIPFLVTGVYGDLEHAPYVVGQVLAVAATVTRVMALPQVEDFLQLFVPWLAAQPVTGEHRADTAYDAPAPGAPGEQFATFVMGQTQALEDMRKDLDEANQRLRELPKDTGRVVADQINQAASRAGRPRRIDPPTAR